MVKFTSHIPGRPRLWLAPPHLSSKRTKEYLQLNAVHNFPMVDHQCRLPLQEFRILSVLCIFFVSAVNGIIGRTLWDVGD